MKKRNGKLDISCIYKVRKLISKDYPEIHSNNII